MEGRELLLREPLYTGLSELKPLPVEGPEGCRLGAVLGREFDHRPWAQARPTALRRRAPGEVKLESGVALSVSFVSAWCC